MILGTFRAGRQASWSGCAPFPSATLPLLGNADGSRVPSTATVSGMLRFTVYLEEHEAAAVRRLAAETGRSQASIIREAVAAATTPAAERPFRSHGTGRGTGEPIGRRVEEILREELGRRR